MSEEMAVKNEEDFKKFRSEFGDPQSVFNPLIRYKDVLISTEKSKLRAHFAQINNMPLGNGALFKHPKSFQYLVISYIKEDKENGKQGLDEMRIFHRGIAYTMDILALANYDTRFFDGLIPDFQGFYFHIYKDGHEDYDEISIERIEKLIDTIGIKFQVVFILCANENYVGKTHYEKTNCWIRINYKKLLRTKEQLNYLHYTVSNPLIDISNWLDNQATLVNRTYGSEKQTAYQRIRQKNKENIPYYKNIILCMLEKMTEQNSQDTLFNVVLHEFCHLVQLRIKDRKFESEILSDVQKEHVKRARILLLKNGIDCVVEGRACSNCDVCMKINKFPKGFENKICMESLKEFWASSHQETAKLLEDELPMENSPILSAPFIREVYDFAGLESALYDDHCTVIILKNNIFCGSEMDSEWGGYTLNKRLYGQGNIISIIRPENGGYKSFNHPLFERIGSYGMVTDLTVIRTGFHQGEIFGGITNLNQGIISNCRVRFGDPFSTDGTYYDYIVPFEPVIAGGIAAENQGIIENCIVDGISFPIYPDTSASFISNKVGGIAGVNNGTICNCVVLDLYVDPNIAGGAIAGTLLEGSEVTHCYYRNYPNAFRDIQQPCTIEQVESKEFDELLNNDLYTERSNWSDKSIWSYYWKFLQFPQSIPVPSMEDMRARVFEYYYPVNCVSLNPCDRIKPSSIVLLPWHVLEKD